MTTKMHNSRDGGRRGALPFLRIALAVGVLSLPLAGCDDILDVDDPDITFPGNFVDETALPAIRAAAIGDFSIAYSGSTGGNSQILYSGMLADEWIHSGTFPTRKEIDIRRILDTNATLQDVTRTLYRARTSAETAVRNFADLGAGTAGHAEVLNLAGYSYIMFGENYCSGVPFSELNEEGGFEFGSPESTQEIFEDRALARFEEALSVAQTAGSTTQEYLARVGMGRALLNLGRSAEAAAAVADVPTDFTYLVTHSENTTREQNVVYNFNNLQERWSVANEEGLNGLPYRDDNDPRVPWTRTGGTDVGFDGETEQYDQLLYPNRGADAVLASGIEARLIEAEAALATDPVSAFTTLNDLRDAAGLDPIVDPGTTDGRVDALFKERAYWMWLTSHRLGDLRRLVRQYGRDTESVYPTGSYFKTGEPYGPDVSLPLPVDEANNPNFVQCDNTIA